MNAIGTIEDFTCAVKYALSAAFPECGIRAVPVTKNNGTCMTEIVMRLHGKDIFTKIYMEPYFAAMQSGSPAEGITAEITSECRTAINMEPSGLNAEDIKDFSAVKDRICYKLVNTALNAGLLEKIPNRSFHDLSIVYYIHISRTDAGTATVPVTNRLADIWNADEETLYGLASRNTMRLRRGIVLAMTDILDGSTEAGALPECGVDAYDGFDVSRSGIDILPMYAVTNTDKTFGAAAVLYESLLDAAAGKLGCGGIFILPSSIHEMLIIPDTFGEAGDIQDMVREINAAEVHADEVLSQNIYHYSVESHDFKMVS